MRLGVFIPTLAARPVEFAAIRPMLEIVQDIEAIGFDSIWAFDTLGRIPSHDPITALGIAASATKLEIGTSVFQLPLRNAVETCHRVMSLQQLAKNGLVFGVGAGSTRQDFENLDCDFDSRFVDLTKSLDIVKQLWRGDKVGETALPLWPGSDESPTIMIGSWASKRWIEKASKEYDGWITSILHTGIVAAEGGMALFKEFGGKRAIASSLLFDSEEKSEVPDINEHNFELPLGIADIKKVLRRLEQSGFDDVIIRCMTGDHEELLATWALI